MSGRPGSFDALRWAEQQTCGGPGPKAVLQAIARHCGIDADGNWSTYVGQQTLADISEQSVRTVGAQLKALEARGLISRKKRGRSGGAKGGRSTDRMTLGFSQYAESAGNSGGPQVTQSANPRTQSANPVTQSANPVTQSATDDDPIGNPLPSVSTRERSTSSDLPTDTSRHLVAVDAVAEVLDDFDRFWMLYPVKVGKIKARASWDRAMRRVDAETVIRSLPAHVAAWQADPRYPKFVPHPTTWLNRGGWDDDVVASKRRGVDILADELAMLEGRA